MKQETLNPNQIWEKVCGENPERQAQKRNIQNDDDETNNEKTAQNEPTKKLKPTPNKPEQQERPREIKRKGRNFPT